jgi:hypothetical protein
MASSATPPRRSWLPGARIPRLKDSHSYGVVLGLIVAMFFFAATAVTAPWSTAVILVLQGLIFAVALWTSARELERNVGALVLVASAALAVVVLSLGTGRVVTGVVAIYSAALTVATVLVIARGVMGQTEINAKSVSGAVSIYVLLGILFVFVYAAIAALGRKPFFVQGATPTRSLLLYFSFVTMTTVGYGDYTAKPQVGRTFAVIEALSGQLYLVTVVAILVSQFGRMRAPR